MALFEIRVPTYRRPEMLRRALNSLLAQEETDWCAFVYDDSPCGEADAVVRSFNDKRIFYLSNPQTLGAAGNIDQASRKQPLTDARFFAILEDDNLLLPHFLKRGQEIVNSSHCSLVQMNQIIVDENARPHQLGGTTRGDWFKHGILPPETLYASLFLMEGLSNGGLFWSRESLTDLEVGNDMQETCLQEACRTLKVSEPVFFESEPCAAWSCLPSHRVMRMSAANRVIGRGQTEIRRYLWQCGGSAMIEAGLRFAKTVGREGEFHINLESSLMPWEDFGAARTNWLLRLRGMARVCMTNNPVLSFLANNPGMFQQIAEPKSFVATV
jgi:glycosyltransferase involved in cell wall biosynthesis